MKLASKIASVVIATAALCGVGAGAAFAGTPTSHDAAHQVKSPMYSRGFNVVNLSSHPLYFEAAGAPEGDSGTLDSGPVDGSILQPGSSQHFEETFWFTKDSVIRAVYLETGADGKTPVYTKGLYYFDFMVNGSGGTGSSAGSAVGTNGTNDLVVNANDETDTLQDPAGTTVNYTPAQQQAAAQTLLTLCQDSNQASCSFTPTDDDNTGNVFSPAVRLVSLKNTSPTEDGTIEIDQGQNFSTTDSWGIDATVSGNIMGLVNSSVSVKYQHQWTTTTSFLAKASHPVAPMTVGELDGQVPVERVTGNFLATMGNTTFNFNGIYFDHPIPNGQPQYIYKASALKN